MNRFATLLITAAIALVIGIGAGLWWAQRPDVGSGESIERGELLSAGAFRVSVEIDPETPRIGANTVRVGLTDQTGAPVNGARVAATAVMPAMGAMAEMRAPADMAQTAPGRYEGRLSLSMDGSWPLAVTIEHAELGEATLEFDMATRRSGLELLSGAAPPQQAAAPESSEAGRDSRPGTIMVDARRRQAIGLRIGEVRRAALRHPIRAVGRVTYDETRLSDVSLRFDAWVGELHANYVGMPVQRGETLFTVYGPDLLTAQQDYLEIRSRGSDGALLDAARKRLELWGLSAEDIAALDRRGSPTDYVPISAPGSGVIIMKDVVEGTAQRAGTTLMTIADLSRVWVEAHVYEADLAIVERGMPATVTLPHLPGRRFEGSVEHIYPFMEAQTRTARIRVSVANPDGVLKPDMYAEVRLDADLGERLVAPAEAVIFAGDSRVVFEDLGDGRLAPHRVQTGVRSAEYIEIIPTETGEVLAPGTRIVTSGVFLIAAESRLQSGLDQW